MDRAQLAIIGGSGLYEIDGLADVEEVEVQTPFGAPSDSIVLGHIDGIAVAFLPRHGRGHRFSPTQVPVRANIYALKTLGVERVLSISAVGSLKESVRPLDMLVPDQLIDRTTRRPNTFFEDGIAAHVAFADPYCPVLSAAVARSARRHSAVTHEGGTYVVIEGPQFSTRAESNLYRSMGVSVIGMTALPEAKLAREAELCYATLALVTDYDCWRESEEEVSVALVVANMSENVAASKAVLRDLVQMIPAGRDCDCASALDGAVITGPQHVSKDVRDRLSAIAGRLW